ncbi:MAG: DNA-formamidopyrimidine glycosylase family protein [Myxococcota bacterium]
MPELPEVEVCRRQLTRWTAGRTLLDVAVRDPAVVRGTLSTRPSDKLPDGETQVRALVGATSTAVSRYGKRLGWTFGDRALVAHLGMTGHWVWRAPGDEPPPSTRIGLTFDTGTAWYVDGRRFGCVVPLDAADLDATLRAGCGPDALAEPLDPDTLRARVSSRKPVKVALMEQDRLAGLGNIHAAEALFRARVSPRLRADALTADQWAALAAAIVAQLQGAVDAEDSDELVYVNLGGPNPFAVYGRAGEPCPVCGTPIATDEQGGRTTYLCPTCQPEGDNLGVTG